MGEVIHGSWCIDSLGGWEIPGNELMAAVSGESGMNLFEKR